MIKLICILSKLLKGNQDCIEIIYNKKKLIEKNEILLFHLLNGLKNMMLYSYSIFTININDTYYYHLTDGPTSPVKYIEEVTGENRIQRYQLHHIDEKIHDGFIKSFQLIKIKDIWNYSYESELENDKRYHMNIIISSIGKKGLIKVREFSDYGVTDGPYYFREAKLKEKINAIKYIIKKHGIFYLDLVQMEYDVNDLYTAIILRSDGSVESILGG